MLVCVIPYWRNAVAAHPPELSIRVSPHSRCVLVVPLMSKKWPIINYSDPHMTVDYLLHRREYNFPFSMPIKTFSLHIYLPSSLRFHFAFATLLPGLYAASVPLHPHVIFWVPCQNYISNPFVASSCLPSGSHCVLFNRLCVVSTMQWSPHCLFIQWFA